MIAVRFWLGLLFVLFCLLVWVFSVCVFGFGGGGGFFVVWVFVVLVFLR